MQPSRINQIVKRAAKLSEAYNKARVVTYWPKKLYKGKWVQRTNKPRSYKIEPRGSIKRNNLILVTLDEHKFLAQHYPNAAKYTRTSTYHDSEYVEDSSLMGSSQLPVVHETWYGARSLSVLRDDDMPEGFRKANELKEDEQEKMELQCLLYHDPKTGVPMIEDSITGKLRKLRIGDMITKVRKANDNLDETFMEEGDDPRQQNDYSAGGTDHKWSDRFRANTNIEHDLLTSKTLPRDHKRAHRIPNDISDTSVNWQMDSIQLRSLAILYAERLIVLSPELESARVTLTDRAYKVLDSMSRKLKIRDGAVINGYFITKQEFFADLEAIHLKNKPPRKGPPPAMDWSVIRGVENNQTTKTISC